MRAELSEIVFFRIGNFRSGVNQSLPKRLPWASLGLLWALWAFFKALLGLVWAFFGTFLGARLGFPRAFFGALLGALLGLE